MAIQGLKSKGVMNPYFYTKDYDSNDLIIESHNMDLPYNVDYFFIGFGTAACVLLSFWFLVCYFSYVNTISFVTSRKRKRDAATSMESGDHVEFGFPEGFIENIKEKERVEIFRSLLNFLEDDTSPADFSSVYMESFLSNAGYPYFHLMYTMKLSALFAGGVLPWMFEYEHFVTLGKTILFMVHTSFPNFTYHDLLRETYRIMKPLYEMVSIEMLKPESVRSVQDSAGIINKMNSVQDTWKVYHHVDTQPAETSYFEFLRGVENTESHHLEMIKRLVDILISVN